VNPFNYFNSLALFGSEGGYNPGLQRVKKLLDYLGNPEKEIKVVHIAGSNGKGSTAAFIDSIYRKAGYKTGLYTSPHFYHFNERIKVNGRPVSTYELKEMTAELKKAAEKLRLEANFGEASFFELVTALALLYFRRHEVDLAVLETGLGGRLDATNVFKNPLLSIITNIDLEHTSILGTTFEEIAKEKAGIIKDKSKVLTAVNVNEALQVIKKEAELKSSEIYILDEEYPVIENSGGLDKNYLTIKKNGAADKYQIGLLGKYQTRNAALAVKAADILNDLFAVSQKNIEQGLLDINWPGRMERISEKPLILLDAAHNPASFSALTESISKDIDKFGRIHFIFSVLADKEINKMLNALLVFKDKLELYIAENSSFRTLGLNELEKAAADLSFNYRLFESLSDAADASLKRAKKNDMIAVSGSFYTVFEAGTALKAKMFRGGLND